MGAETCWDSTGRRLEADGWVLGRMVSPRLEASTVGQWSHCGHGAAGGVHVCKLEALSNLAVLVYKVKITAPFSQVMVGMQWCDLKKVSFLFLKRSH